MRKRQILQQMMNVASQRISRNRVYRMMQQQQPQYPEDDGPLTLEQYEQIKNHTKDKTNA
jgi:hypothetical protein